MKKTLLLFFAIFILNAGLFAQTVTVYVKDGSTPVSNAKVSFSATGDVGGGWSWYFSLMTDENGKVVTPQGENLGGVMIDLAVETLPAGMTFPSYRITIDEITGDMTVEFNTSVVRPEISNITPNTSVIELAVGTSLTFSADVVIDGETIDDVTFDIDNYSSAGEISSGNTYTAQNAWTPLAEDYYKNYTLSVTASGSNGSSTTEILDFYLDCGGNCPNQPPVVSLLSPQSWGVNQLGGFEVVDFLVSATDNDGTIQSVEIVIDGSTHQMNSTGNDEYSFSFTPDEYKSYPVTITVTDNEGGTKTLNKTLSVTDATYVPLPEKVIVGYWHSWDNASAPFMYLRDLIGTGYNVVVYSFIETVGSDGFTPVLTTNDNAYMTGGVFDPQLLKDDVKALQDAGVPVLVSVGGQNGHVDLSDTQKKNTFVNGCINIIEEYGFDGFDIDFEGGSMQFGTGQASDFDYNSITDANLKNIIDAIREIDAHFGPGFHITAAPETFYVQVGKDTYSTGVGSFLAVAENIRDILDYIHVQLYNTGSISALDGVAYSQGTSDFIVAMCDMLLKGFDVASTGVHFDALEQRQVAVGLPSCPAAAPAGGYATPEEVTRALDYLTKGISFGGSYDTGGAVYPDLRGVMTWSVNWDKASACAGEWEFVDYNKQYFDVPTGQDLLTIPQKQQVIYPNPVADILNIGMDNCIYAEMFSINGEKVYSAEIEGNQINMSGIRKGVYMLRLTNSGGEESVFKVVKK